MNHESDVGLLYSAMGCLGGVATLTLSYWALTSVWVFCFCFSGGEGMTQGWFCSQQSIIRRLGSQAWLTMPS